MIPKKIHYCWFGGNELPEKDKKCIESWKKYCPDYEIVRWDESNYDISKCAYMKEAYDVKRYGFVPDYARLDIVYEHGGIYLDTDVELIQSLDGLLELSGFAGFEAIDQDEKFVALGLGFGAEKNNSVIKAMRDDYDHRHFILQDGSHDITPSPALSTKVLTSLGLKTTGVTQCIGNFKIFSEEYFCPKSCVTDEYMITDNTISIHHYNASWLTDKEKKRTEYVKYWKQKLGRGVGSKVGIIVYYIKEEGIVELIKKIVSKMK